MTAAPGFALREEDLVGREVRIGDVRLLVAQSIVRCVTTTYDIETGASTPSVLREVVRQRNERVGIYCDVITTGTIAIGDAVLSAVRPQRDPPR